MTPKKALRLLDTRDPRICVLTGYQGDRIVPQHRQGGMGGRPDKHRTANLLWIDSILNGDIESDPGSQLLAKVYGVSVPRWADVEHVPVWYAHESQWYALTGDTREPVTVGGAHQRMHDVYGTEWFTWLEWVEGSDLAAVRTRAWS